MNDCDFTKSKGRHIFEYVLLIACLCVIAVRVFIAEGIGQDNVNQTAAISGDLYKVALSGVLVFLFLVWLLAAVWDKGSFYRLSYMEIGAAVFVLAAVVSTLAAADKRAAVTDSVTRLAPMMMALLLVQILDSKKNIRLLLYTLAALGAIGAVYCATQFFWTNDLIIAEYQKDPAAVLEKISVTPGSFQSMLFENSLYSRDVRGFFTTGNSAGSFGLLTCFAAVALLIENFKKRKTATGIRPIVTTALFAAITIFGLVLTGSKGAIAGAVIAWIMFLVYSMFGNWLRANKKGLLTVCLLFGVLVSSVVISYGLRKGRLPGGNSMLVRWQYWHGAVQMYADHAATGVGGGNFESFYTHYKAAGALESVTDPHNFVLALLTQYGVIGLIGFLAAVSVGPACMIFAKNQKRPCDITGAVLFVAIAGFLIHNCIDFAIFEPGILTVFWATVACLTAVHINTEELKPKLIKLNNIGRIAITAISVLAVCAYIVYVYLPVAKTTAKIKLASEVAEFGQLEPANNILTEAVKVDRLSGRASALNGRIYLRRFYLEDSSDMKLLLAAEKNLIEAIDRNRADFKNFERLAEVYILLCQLDNSKNDHWLSDAFDSAVRAARLYPGCARLRIRLAEIALRSGKNDIAVANYKKAIEIEEQYRAQFAVMYPGRPLFSRLGEELYEHARQKIKDINTQKMKKNN